MSEDPRRVIIGVIGGNKQHGVVADAKKVGEQVMLQQCILLTGGEPGPAPHVKDAAMLGAAEGARDEARLIGILPHNAPPRRKWDSPCSHRLFLHTGLTSPERDPINGVTPDVLIVFPGTEGTLCELAFAVAKGRPIFFWKAAPLLRGALYQPSGKLKMDLKTAFDACGTKLLNNPVPSIATSCDLLNNLCQAKTQWNDFVGDWEQIVRAAKAAALPKCPSDFPGFKDDPGSRERFDEIVRRM